MQGRLARCGLTGGRVRAWVGSLKIPTLFLGPTPDPCVSLVSEWLAVGSFATERLTAFR